MITCLLNMVAEYRRLLSCALSVSRTPARLARLLRQRIRIHIHVSLFPFLSRLKLSRLFLLNAISKRQKDTINSLKIVIVRWDCCWQLHKKIKFPRDNLSRKSRTPSLELFLWECFLVMWFLLQSAEALFRSKTRRDRDTNSTGKFKGRRKAGSCRRRNSKPSSRVSSPFNDNLINQSLHVSFILLIFQMCSLHASCILRSQKSRSLELKTWNLSYLIIAPLRRDADKIKCWSRGSCVTIRIISLILSVFQNDVSKQDRLHVELSFKRNFKEIKRRY